MLPRPRALRAKLPARAGRDLHARVRALPSACCTAAREVPVVSLEACTHTACEEGEKKYAAPEISILSEINHPNVIRCLQSVELPRSRLVVLTLADGPNLGELVNVGGALSVGLCRLAARHLISAVAYLHGRGKLMLILVLCILRSCAHISGVDFVSCLSITYIIICNAFFQV